MEFASTKAAPPRGAIAPYRRLDIEKGVRIVLPVLVIAGLGYGFGLSLLAPSIVMPFLVPVIALGLLVIWALPETDWAPTKTLAWLLIAFLIALPLWPNYLAIALPGMPWITLLRIIGAPMILLLLIALSVSAEFRRGLCASLDATAPVWKMLVALVIIQFLSLARSEEHTSELQSLMRISYAVFCLKKKNIYH